MKRLIMVAAVAVALLSTACKKDWNCRCEGNIYTTMNGQTATTPEKRSFLIDNKKHSDAETRCNEIENSYDDGNSIVNNTPGVGNYGTNQTNDISCELQNN